LDISKPQVVTVGQSNRGIRGESLAVAVRAIGTASIFQLNSVSSLAHENGVLTTHGPV
jgi:hypothetical protein